MNIKVTRVTSEVVVRQVRIPYRTEENLILIWIAVNPKLSGKVLKALVKKKSSSPMKTAKSSMRLCCPARYCENPSQSDESRNPQSHKDATYLKSTFRHREVLTMTATAYEPGPTSCGKWADGYTAIGLKAEPGIVAVDPKVIPLGTRLYVEGYGPALAGDVGGAIKGNRIDLLFETVEEALRYGRRKVKVYILEP